MVSLPPAEFDAQHGISAVWQRAARGQGITVAVVDTALDPSHPDLDGGVIECACRRSAVRTRELSNMKPSDANNRRLGTLFSGEV